MRDDRWTTVTESEFQHERRGLEAIRALLPDNEPWRAWSNFTFTARSGHVREVDLLVVAPGGVYLIELKDWHGSVESRNGSWLQTQPSGVQIPHGNPRHLANKKARELGDLLRRAAPARTCSNARLSTQGPPGRTTLPATFSFPRSPESASTFGNADPTRKRDRQLNVPRYEKPRYWAGSGIPASSS